MSVIVTGASGNIGRLVAEKLIERLEPSELVLVSRRPEALREFADRGADVRYGDFSEPGSLPAAIAPVSRRDCAEAAAIVLTTDGHAGRTFEITGPEALSQRDLAAVYADVSGRPVKVTPIGDKMLVMGLVLHGVSRPVARAVADFGRAVREGFFDVVDPTFETLSGRPPMSLREGLIPRRGDLLEVA